jgi:ferredoxin/flavodoxin---NADP+ reductase
LDTLSLHDALPICLIRDPEIYERFDHVVVAHSVRLVSDLGYRDYIENELAHHELVGEQAARQLLYYPTVTREPFRNQGRLTTLLDTGKLGADIGLPALDPAHDRVMICGGPSMLAALVGLLERRGFEEGGSAGRGQYVIERAFVEK